MFNVITTIDVVACLCAIAALLVLIKGWDKKFTRLIKSSIAALILLMLFHDGNNFFEWAGIQTILKHVENVEYYIEILVPVVWFLVLYFFSQSVIRHELESVAHEWQTTFDCITDAVCLIDLDRKIIKANKAMIKLVDIPEDEVVGSNCCYLIHGQCDPIDKCPVHKMKQTKKRENLEMAKENKYFNVIADPVKLDGGEISGVVHIIQDITMRKRIDLLKSTLIRDVSHTLKSPLAVVRMACTMMDKGIEKGDMEKVKRGQQIAKDNTDKAVRDIESILKMASLEGAGLPMSARENVSLKDLFEGIIEDIPTNLEDKGIELVIDIPLEADKVLGIESDLKMLFENILENAYKFTEKGKISISTQLNGPTVDITVSDTGRGIDAAHIGMVFDKFYKRNLAGSGIGLGLSICKEIVNRNEGNIEIVSEGEGKGTIVRVSLPQGQ